jgi:hypothetical protein
MTIRIEFYQSRSPYFSLALSLCRQEASFREDPGDAGMRYSIEASHITPEISEIMRLCSSWKCARFFLNGRQVRPYQINRHYFDPAYPRPDSMSVVIDAEVVRPGSTLALENRDA